MSTSPKEFHGYVEDTRDALLLIEASAQNLIKQRKMRLSLEERLKIRSGSTFIYNETVTHFKRWSDGISWGPSRLINGFFVYQQQSTLPYAAKDLNDPLKCRLSKHDTLHKKAIVAVAPNGHVYHLFNYYRPSDVINGKLKVPKYFLNEFLNDIEDKIIGYTFKGMTSNPVSTPNSKQLKNGNQSTSTSGNNSLYSSKRNSLISTNSILNSNFTKLTLFNSNQSTKFSSQLKQNVNTNSLQHEIQDNPSLSSTNEISPNFKLNRPLFLEDGNILNNNNNSNNNNNKLNIPSSLDSYHLGLLDKYLSI